MSTQRKKTLAKLRAEKEQRRGDLVLGCQLIQYVCDGLNYTKALQANDDRHSHSKMKNLLGQANRACELLQFHQDTDEYHLLLAVKADVHNQLGQYRMAEATYLQADEAYAKAERNGVLTAIGHSEWMMSLVQLGSLYLTSQQLESAKRCYLCQTLLPPDAGIPSSKCRSSYQCPPRHGPISQETQRLGRADRVLQAGPRAFSRSQSRTTHGTVHTREVSAIPC